MGLGSAGRAAAVVGGIADCRRVHKVIVVVEVLHKVVVAAAAVAAVHMGLGVVGHRRVVDMAVGRVVAGVVVVDRAAGTANEVVLGTYWAGWVVDSSGGRARGRKDEGTLGNLELEREWKSSLVVHIVVVVDVDVVEVLAAVVVVETTWGKGVAANSDRAVQCTVVG
ncbi:predicted protein [Histoplasma capsulatum var. duboisii H88]|uniref:Predicted protein n=1 Tax=Ajellomyces capsulatus (strain H88) TaxID=544711 RepID=F0ULS1_AJEC8|nr:predicted protein [Histoplasma capsulatum var. duboisii H88]